MRLPVVPDKPDGVYRSPGADVAAPRGAIVNRMVKSSTALDRTFAALADPYRRELLHRLTSGPRTVGELAAGLPISLVAVSKHLTVLEDAGYVDVKKGYDGKRPRTWLSLSERGRAAYEEYLMVLSSITRATRAPD